MDLVWFIVDYVNTLPTSVLTLLVIGLVTLYYWPIWTMYKYPPGPIPWPFVNHFPLMIQHYDELGQYFYGEFLNYREEIMLV